MIRTVVFDLGRFDVTFEVLCRKDGQPERLQMDLTPNDSGSFLRRVDFSLTGPWKELAVDVAQYYCEARWNEPLRATVSELDGLAEESWECLWRTAALVFRLAQRKLEAQPR